MVNRPSKDILIERITITNGHAISVGSETSGGISNVRFKGTKTSRHTVSVGLDTYAGASSTALIRFEGVVFCAQVHVYGFIRSRSLRSTV